ncbi:cytochrome P450 71A1-like [Papaver somniferum]|uniref:cytochrome P450 71A1-like n=1 Tax=Papaver somniferum TaxID=3469 RepID=UPI000E6FEDA5|nr:cytochrome P450 71A1-like [Papaver somniferum]
MSLTVLLQWGSGLMEQPAAATSLLVLFLIPIVLFFIRLGFKSRKTKLNLPPSPPNKLPILGHLLQLGKVPHVNLQHLARKHGSLMLLYLGNVPTLVVSSAELVKQIFHTHDHVFASRPSSYVAKKFSYNYKDFAFTPYGEYWKQMRKICVLQLLNAKRIHLFRSIRTEEVASMLDKISSGSRTSVSSSPEKKNFVAIDLTETLMSFTSDVICRVAFGRKYSDEEIIGRKFGDMVRDMFCLFTVENVGDFIPWLSWVNNFNGLYRKVDKTFKEIDGFLEVVVEEHIQVRKTRASSSTLSDFTTEEDLVDVLLGIHECGGSTGDSLGRDNIKAIVLDIFIGATDSSTSVLEWAMAELLRNPQMMKQAQEEVRRIAKGKPNVTEDDLSEMHYLHAVIKETLRVHPSAPLLVPHQSTEISKLQGYDIPANAIVLTNAWAIGRDPISWEEPGKFEPKRFMNSFIDYKGQHFEFIPFGVGRRGCPGMQFAESVIELALANLLHRFDWVLPNGAKEYELDMSEAGFGVITTKKTPLVVVAIDHLQTFHQSHTSV